MWGGGPCVCARSRLSRRGRRFLPLTQTHQQGNKGEERAAAAAPHNAGALLSMTCDGGRLPPLPCPAHGPHPAVLGGHSGTPKPDTPWVVLIQGVPHLKARSACAGSARATSVPVPGAARLGSWLPKIPRVRGVRCVKSPGMSLPPSRQLLRQPRGSRFSWGHPLGSPSCCAHSQGFWAPPGGFWVQGLVGGSPEPGWSCPRRTGTRGGFGAVALIFGVCRRGGISHAGAGTSIILTGTATAPCPQTLSLSS